jgi:hypothetical protein
MHLVVNEKASVSLVEVDNQKTLDMDRNKYPGSPVRLGVHFCRVSISRHWVGRHERLTICLVQAGETSRSQLI